MARSAQALCALALLLLGTAQACQYLSGGAGAFGDAGPILTKAAAEDQKINTALPLATYQTSSADLGVVNFTAGVFCTSVTDSPFRIDQETAFAKAWPGAKAPSTNKYSLPIVIASFGFFVNPGPGKTTAVVSLTWKDTFNIFYKGGSWNQVFESSKDVKDPVKNAFPITTVITPYSRIEPAGATELVKAFWVRAANGSFTFPAGVFGTGGVITGDPFPYNAATKVGWFTGQSYVLLAPPPVCSSSAFQATNMSCSRCPIVFPAAPSAHMLPLPSCSLCPP